MVDGHTDVGTNSELAGVGFGASDDVEVERVSCRFEKPDRGRLELILRLCGNGAGGTEVRSERCSELVEGRA